MTPPPAVLLPTELRNTGLGFDRCPACHYALATIRGHRAHCPFGFRARFAITHDGLIAGTHNRGPEGLT